MWLRYSFIVPSKSKTTHPSLLRFENKNVDPQIKIEQNK